MNTEVKKPIRVAIIGRPNVGKSSLFNRMCKKRIAISHEEEGVTRDRIYGELEFFGKEILLIDTGGIDTRSNLPFHEEIKRQALLAVEEADSLIMVVDSRSEVTSLDEEVANILLRSNKPLVLAVNKVDRNEDEHKAFVFESLGISEIVPVSAAQNYRLTDLLEKATEGLHEGKKELKDKGIKVAIVGRANVGKSTLLNKILQEERAIVSDIAGTTRDAINAEIEINGTLFTFVDTAGIRRKKSEKNVIEKFASMRTKKAIEEADVCILVLDAREGMRAEDKKIACMIEEAGKGCILLFNKWDLVKNFRMEECLKAVRSEVAFLSHVPAHFISAKEGRNISRIFSDVMLVVDELGRRVTTGQLNRFLEKCIQKVHPPLITGKRLRIYYLTQISTVPPRFILFVNYPDLLVQSYKKYLINEFRKNFAFTGAPIFFKLKKRSQRENEGFHLCTK